MYATQMYVPDFRLSFLQSIMYHVHVIYRYAVLWVGISHKNMKLFNDMKFIVAL